MENKTDALVASKDVLLQFYRKSNIAILTFTILGTLVVNK